MKKIVVDLRMIESSGIGTYIRGILPYLNTYMPRIQVVCLGDPVVLSRNGILIENVISFTPPIYSIKEQLLFPKVIPECDLFWSPHFITPIFPIKARKMISTVHDVFFFAFFDILTIKQKLYTRIMFSKTFSQCTKIITVSHFSKSEITKFCGQRAGNKTTVIYNGTDTNFNQYDKTKVTVTLPEIPYILVVGNVKPHKSIPAAIRAFKIVLKKFPELKMIIIGKRDGFITGDNTIESVLSELPKGTVEFLGHLSEPDMKFYYDNARMLLFPSKYEGFGLPILEAMSFGLPVAASSAASIPEVGGNQVHYFAPENIDEMAQKMELILSKHLRLDYTDQLSLFSWRKSAQRHCEIFLNILESN